MVKRCVVCGEPQKPHSIHSFHRFPQAEVQRKAWVKACGLEAENMDADVKILCSKHFRDCDYDPYIWPGRRLLHNAVPSPSHIYRAIPSTSQANEDLQVAVTSRPDNVWDLKKDTDPLEITAADSLCLFGDSASNIEFVIESDEEPEVANLGTKENPYVIQIAEITESAVNQPVPAGVSEAISHETVEVIDLDASSDEEEIKEEIEIEEGVLQTFEVEKEGELPKIATKDTSNSKENLANQSKVLNALCYVPNCTIDEKEKDKILWFKAPYDNNLRKIWDICIDRPDKRLSPEDIICSQHFADNDIVYNISNKNGIIMNATPREGAVPCIKFHERCCVPFCETRTGNMFCFPVLRTSNFHLWLYMIRNADLKKLKMKDVLRHRVCARHFEKDCFDNGTLKSTAAPTLHLPEVSLSSLNPEMNPVQRLEAVDASKCKLCCAYGVCSNTNSNKKVFRFPENPDRCIAWLKACKRTGLITTPQATVKRMSTGYLGVCEDHFREHNFDTPTVLKFNAVPFSELGPATPVVRKSTSASSSEILQKYYETKEALLKDIKPSGFTGICSYKGCYLKVSTHNPFFSFPVDEARSAKWLKACGIVMSSPMLRYQILKNQRICSKHFTSDMFESKYKLKANAVPIPYVEKQNEASATAAQESNTEFAGKKIRCAVKFCQALYISRYGKGAFPSPSGDRERFDIWLKLVNNEALKDLSPEDIKANYMVCLKHFENLFYMKDGKMTALSDEAVPTRQLSTNSQWFLSSSYYENRLKKYLETCGIAGFKCTPSGLLPISESCEIESEEPADEIDEEPDSTVCILENEGIRFPKSGHYLPIQRTSNLKRKFPYNVYKLHKAGYGISSDVNAGEHIRIHTAIIIDDDDECERQVLEQLLDKRRKTKV